MVELLGTMLAGGATGIFGSLINRVASYFERKQERKFILEKYKLDAEARKDEYEYHMEEAQLEANTQALKASYQHDSNIGVASKWVINTLKLVRPVLTLLLIALTSSIIYELLSSDMMGADQLDYIIQSVFYLTTTSITWWFGDRSRNINK